MSSEIDDMPASTPSGIVRPIVATRSSLIANVTGDEDREADRPTLGSVGIRLELLEHCQHCEL